LLASTSLSIRSTNVSVSVSDEADFFFMAITASLRRFDNHSSPGQLARAPR
jgi:hypothetical protein